MTCRHSWNNNLCREISIISELTSLSLFEHDSNILLFFFLETQNALLALSSTDIHAVAGLLKLYLRELPKSLFTSKLYNKFVEGLSKFPLFN